jgi:predicted short-subunit dehydrogenase-like oxidoreductase (DUF2520 family)
MKHYNLSFAGAGRVAGALCMKMHKSGCRIIQIVSNTGSEGKQLAINCNAEWTSDLSFSAETDIIIVAVPDHRLGEVLSTIECAENSIVAHTAGSYGLELFPSRLKRKGVFYPLQTFSKGRETDFNQLPFLIEASDKKSTEYLGGLAEHLGGKPYFVDSESRRIVHLSAVFVNNFTNFMLTAGKDISSKAALPFSILEPLIKETILKALENGPELSQTGPAIRNDYNTIEKHLELLSFSPDLKNLYNEVTNSIITYYKNKG